jgi:hypothetical protein
MSLCIGQGKAHYRFLSLFVAIMTMYATARYSSPSNSITHKHLPKWPISYPINVTPSSGDFSVAHRKKFLYLMKCPDNQRLQPH